MEKTATINREDLLRASVMASSLYFTRYYFKVRMGHSFITGEHHRQICEALDQVLQGKKTRLIINMPPRYGKTEIAVKNFISMGFAINPKSKFLHLSYSADLTRSNSSEINEFMSEPEYCSLFPEAQPVSHGSKHWETRAGGVLYAVSTSGQVTGFGAGLVEDPQAQKEASALVEDLDQASSAGTFGGAIVIDDPIKPEDALSDNVREKINQRFENTIRSRVNSRNTPIVIIMQRLHEHDLCGYLMEAEPDQWEVLSLPCIITDEEGAERPLWPHKHTLEELRRMEAVDAFTFQTQYMQNPRPREGLMYSEFKTYQELPITRKQTIKAYIDTADTGTDYLCCIIYAETETANYIIDVYFTDKPMEVTESETARRLSKYRVDVANIESNNGGRGFARNVEKYCRVIQNAHTTISWFTQSQNKDARIFSHSAEVTNLTYMPEGWNHLWPDFYRAITQYRKSGRNEHDDAPDALTGTIEKRNNTQRGNAGYFF